MQGVKINDEFNYIPCSVRRLQLRRKRDGICLRCRRKATVGLMCRKHYLEHKRADHKYRKWLKDHGY